MFMRVHVCMRSGCAHTCLDFLISDCAVEVVLHGSGQARAETWIPFPELCALELLCCIQVVSFACFVFEKRE